MNLLRSAESEREELRNELQSLIGQDLTELTARQLRRYEQQLAEYTEWYTAVDDYCHMIRNNYMTCLEELTGTADTLRALLSGRSGESIQLDPLP